MKIHWTKYKKKCIQNHTLNIKKIIDNKTKKYIRPPYTLLTTSKNFSDDIGKTMYIQ